MKNNQLQSTIATIQVTEVPFWKQVARILKKPTRNQPAVNVSKIERYASDKIIVIPGKILGTGRINKKVTVAAWSASEKAKQKITAAGGSIISLIECNKKYADGKKLIIIT